MELEEYQINGFVRIGQKESNMLLSKIKSQLQIKYQ